MLVLSRKRHQRVIISDNICVEVVEIRSDKVRLGFSAPDETSIHREEIWLKIKKRAAEGGDDGNV